MAKAPRPGTRPGDDSGGNIVRFNLTDGESVTVDMRTLTMVDRRTIRAELKKHLGEDTDELEGLVGCLWVVMRRTDPGLEFMSVFERCSVTTFTDAEEADDEVTYDDPEGSGPSSKPSGRPSRSSTASNRKTSTAGRGSRPAS